MNNIKKFLLGYLCLSYLFVFGQNNITTVSYENDLEKTSIVDLMNLMNIQNIEIKIENRDFKNKKILLEEVSCQNGEFENKILNDFMPLNFDTDTIKIRFLSVPLNNDSVKILLKTPIFELKLTERIPTFNSLLIEMKGKSVYNDCDTIPLLIYSTGIPKKFEFNGGTAYSYDICGLRDSEISPYEFHKEFGLQDYIFFNLILKEKTDNQ